MAAYEQTFGAGAVAEIEALGQRTKSTEAALNDLQTYAMPNGFTPGYAAYHTVYSSLFEETKPRVRLSEEDERKVEALVKVAGEFKVGNAFYQNSSDPRITVSGEVSRAAGDALRNMLDEGEVKFKNGVIPDADTFRQGLMSIYERTTTVALNELKNRMATLSEVKEANTAPARAGGLEGPTTGIGI